MTEEKTLWKTRVGSKLWGTDTPESDEDLFIAFAVPTIAVLVGERYDRSHNEGGPDDDTDKESHEIYRIVEQLQKGNINHIIGLTSDTVKLSTVEHSELVAIFTGNPARNLTASCIGMSRGIQERGMKKGWPERRTHMKAMCPIMWAFMYYLSHGGRGRSLPPWEEIRAHFRGEKDIGILDMGDDPIFSNYTATGVEAAKNHLRDLHNTITVALPDKPDPVPYKNFLLEARLRDLKEAGLCQ